MSKKGAMMQLIRHTSVLSIRESALLKNPYLSHLPQHIPFVIVLRTVTLQ
jgi:hypothetical protein